MYKLAVLLTTSLLCAACSDPPSISVDCSKGALASDGATIVCGDGNSNTTITNEDGDSEPSTPAQPVILQAGCFQDVAVCPTAYPLSWVIEHCSIAYACPLRHPDAGPDELICLRFIEDECVDKYTN